MFIVIIPTIPSTKIINYYNYTCKSKIIYMYNVNNYDHIIMYCTSFLLQQCFIRLQMQALQQTKFFENGGLMSTQEKGCCVVDNDSSFMRYREALIPFSANSVPLPAPSGTKQIVS